MPFRHVALYRWSDTVDDDRLAALGAAFGELAAVPGVRNVTHGVDAGLSVDGYDHVVVIDVDTETTWRTLRDHPTYILLIEEHVTPHLAMQATAQFRVDDAAATEVDDVDVRDLSDDELLERARRAAQASMDALLAEPDDVF